MHSRIPGGYLWWDFVASPDGSNPADFQIQFGSHPVSRGNYRVDSGWPYRTGVPTDHTTWGQAPGSQVQSHVVFATAKAAGDGNSFQKHVSMPSFGGSTFFDQNYWVGTSLYCAQNLSCVTNITGTLYQYHYETSTNYQAGVVMARKMFPTVAKTAGRSFQDVSGPGSVLGGTSGDNYKYCVALLANECVGGSTPGNIYFNYPALDGERSVVHWRRERHQCGRHLHRQLVAEWSLQQPVQDRKRSQWSAILSQTHERLPKLRERLHQYQINLRW